TLLDDIETNLINAAGGSATEADKAGYQANIDLAIGAIDNLVANTRFNGARLLDGSMAYSTAGVNPSLISDVRISRSNGGDATINIETTAAQAAQLSTNNYSAV